jgi:hypothetical protein
VLPPLPQSDGLSVEEAARMNILSSWWMQDQTSGVEGRTVERWVISSVPLAQCSLSQPARSATHS